MSKGLTLHPVPPESVALFWDDVEGFISSACAKGPGGLNPRDLCVSCETSQHQLWVLLDGAEAVAAGITGIWTEGVRRAEWIAFGASPGVDWQAFMPLIEDWARRHGCTAFRSYGRPGMKTRMPREYRVKGVIFEKDLTHGR